MLERLQTLGNISRGLQPSEEELGQWMKLLTDYSTRFTRALPEAKSFQSRPWKPPTLSEASVPLPSLLGFLEESVLIDGFHAASGRFMAYVPGGGVPTAAIADFLVALSNRYSGSYSACPNAIEIENSCLRWFIEWSGMPASTWGSLSSGGTLSTLSAVVAAREGLAFEDRARAVVYATSQTHHCLKKSLRIAGFRSETLQEIAVDENYRMDVEALERQITSDRKSGRLPWIVVGSAGTTNTGSVDPLPRLADICQREKLWFHVDGAYGGFFCLTEEGKKKLAGMERADSLVLDPHKGLFLPYGCGAVLVREAGFLKSAYTETSAYLADLAGVTAPSPDDYSPELTRHFRALRVWLTLQTHGLARFRAALEEKLLLCRYAHAELSRMDNIEVGPSPDLSCLVFRSKKGDVATAELHKKVNATLRVFLSSTRLRGEAWIRICILNFRTHLPEVEDALAAIRGAVKQG